MALLQISYNIMDAVEIANLAEEIKAHYIRLGHCNLNFVCKRRERLQSHLAELVERQKSANVEDEDMEIELHEWALPDDLLHTIFLSLSAESLLRVQAVCKQWFSLINSSIFIQAHAQHSETVLIYYRSIPLLQVKAKRFFFQYASLEDGDGSYVESGLDEPLVIQGGCDGLIIVFNGRRRRLYIMNPVTRKQMELPPGSSCASGMECVGMAYCKEEKTYKVVHLFEGAGMKISCEVMNINLSRAWKRIEGPNVFIDDSFQIPVCLGGSLHWLLGGSCISMNVCDEKLVATNLPHTGINVCCEPMLVEIGGNLGYIARAADAPVNLDLGVWILRENSWVKTYTLRLNGEVRFCRPVYSRRNGREMLLQTSRLDGYRVYAYDLETDQVRVVGAGFEEPWFGYIRPNFILHRKTLVWF